MMAATSVNALGISIAIASQFEHSLYSSSGLPSCLSLLHGPGLTNNTTSSGMFSSSNILSEHFCCKSQYRILRLNFDARCVYNVELEGRKLYLPASNSSSRIGQIAYPSQSIMVLLNRARVPFHVWPYIT